MSDKSVACNAISIALLHIFVDGMDGKAAFAGGWDGI